MGSFFQHALRPSTRIRTASNRSAAWLLSVVLAGFAALIGTVHGADLRQVLANPEYQVARSSSGQFVIAAPRNLATLDSPGRLASGGTNRIELSTQTLVVSCEGIKAALLRTLRQPDVWRGRIHVVINPQLTEGQSAIIGARPFLDGWQYQVDLPGSMEPVQVVRAIIHVLLLELANRNAGLRSAEIPFWLSEGLTQHIIRSSQSPLVMPRPRTTVREVQVGWDYRPPTASDPLESVRGRLRTHAALSFTRMGEIDSEQMSEEMWLTFQACTQLFVDQLLRLPHSHDMLVGMLLQLPHHLNWQIAFLKAFRPHFPRMLDVEKWWSVVLVYFTGLDAVHAWSIDVALARLQDALHPPVMVVRQPTDLPERTHLSIQQIINQFDYLKQRILLQDLNHQLGLLRVRMPIQVVSILDDYRRTIENYLERRDRAGMTRSLPGLPPLNSDRLVNEIIQRLDELDRQRATLAIDQAGPSATTASLVP